MAVEKQIAAALVKAQQGFKPALKTSENPHLKSRYADLASCIEAVIDSLHENGIALIQKTEEAKDGISIETMFLHESGESFTAGWLFVPASQQSAQSFGSALTYARRYSLMTACGIAPEDDDGNAARMTSKREEPDYWSSAKIEPFSENVAKAPESVGNLPEPPLCDHGHMILIEGISKKTGNPYRGYNCPEKKCETIWQVKSKTTGEWRFA